MRQPADQPPALTFHTIIILVLAVRIAAHYALTHPLQGNSLALFAQASQMAQGIWPAWNGNELAAAAHAYPALLALAFAVFGAGTKLAFGINLLLAMISATLLALIIRASVPAENRQLTQSIALLAYALWPPLVMDCSIIAAENLWVPLGLGAVLAAIRVLRRQPRLSPVAVAGVACVALLITGSTVLPLWR